MKKSLLVALAFSMLAAPVLTAVDASAQSRQQVREYREDQRELRQDRRELRQDRREIRKDQRQIRKSRPAWMKQGGRYQRGGTRISDYKRYGLRAPGRNQRWVKVDNTYILVGITSGIIASIIASR
jgi:Ni/Co efflux regulator RcnB